jgi:hypothetical protein
MILFDGLKTGLTIAILEHAYYIWKRILPGAVLFFLVTKEGSILIRSLKMKGPVAEEHGYITFCLMRMREKPWKVGAKGKFSRKCSRSQRQHDIPRIVGRTVLLAHA